MTQEPNKKKIAFKLGDDTIHVVVHENPAASLTMINVHDDEDTSVTAGLTTIKEKGGRLVELVHSGERLVTFNVGGKQYIFDPNRVFSDAGITDTLNKHSSHSPAAHAAIKSFAQEYLQTFAFAKEPVIIALHNATEGTFSIKSFLSEGEHGAASSETYISPRHNRFDFFYVTDKRFYDYFKALDFNVTLQSSNVPDDGSLSVFFSNKGIPYLNIEAEMRHLPAQIEMVKVAREMVDKLIPR